MSVSSRELKIHIESFLGSSKIYWQGNSPRIAFPSDAAEKLDLKRRKGLLFDEEGATEKFLFFYTDAGILIKPIDKKTEKYLTEILGFTDISKISDDDLKFLFG